MCFGGALNRLSVSGGYRNVYGGSEMDGGGYTCVVMAIFGTMMCVYGWEGWCDFQKLIWSMSFEDFFEAWGSDIRSVAVERVAVWSDRLREESHGF